MSSRDKAGIVAITLTFALAVAILANALLASAAWQPPTPPARAPSLPPPPSLPLPLPLSPSPPPSPPPRVLHVRSGETEAQGITRESARRALRSAIPQIERCYRTARDARPELEGRIMVHVALQPHRVDTELMTTTAGDDTILEPCVVQALAYARWPTVRARAEVVVPFILDTTAD